MVKLTPVLFLALFVLALSQRTFHDHKVFRIPVQTRSTLDFLAGLFYGNTTLDFWTEPVGLYRNVDIHVSPIQATWLSVQLENRGIEYNITIDNVQELVDGQLTAQSMFSNDVGDIDYSVYHTYDEVITWIKTLPSAYPNLVTLVPLGSSYQGRELLAVKITAGSTPKPAIWFDGGLHAREWITTATVIYILGNILSDYGTDPTITTLVNGLEIYVLPIFNPDGYSYTWTSDRMWRKTRRPNTGSSCVGTDPNRNWDFEWGGAGTNTNPCSEAFCGPTAFSEIEVRTIALFIRDAQKFIGYINFHAYGQLWMGPWGYTDDLPIDFAVQNRLGGLCAAAIASVHGVQYQYGPISSTIYPASGSSADYTYGAAEVLFSYGVELRDQGQYGFLLPASQIVPSGEETYEAVKVWAKAVLEA